MDEFEPPAGAGAGDVMMSSDEKRSGIPNDIVLAPADHPIPVRCPEDFQAILLTEIDIVDDFDLDRDGDVLHMTGRWLTTLPTPDERHDGDLVVVLHEPTTPPASCDAARHVDIEMRLVNGNRWQQVGIWTGVNSDWPYLIAPTAAAIMGLHTDILELEDPPRRVRSASSERDAEFLSATCGEH
ncbi:hypothetical protein [Amycolatopsis vastitatis]|uniref:Uncharacterized protein n=1 Tax=Amycolatopsis vastitatis TaxID=1905142 RepID=A0A229SL89_9PSEU|nr:hypothetical protein [Amycolatopsis vastitatis]OXM59550.1 hypothetical protein CF165_46940 [Amycolatopsis vastitatis]